jgi:hypothetical protein
MKKYIAETYVRLTASSVIGFILLTIFIERIDEALVGGSYYFLVTPIGIDYWNYLNLLHWTYLE